MARLEFALHELTAEGHDPATVVDLVGSVDPDTLEIFESMMDQLIDSSRCRVIFNLEKLKYINSTGMGMSVQFADQLVEENGGLVFMKVPPKVLLVIEMLGLQELFQIVSNEEQALAALAGGEVGPASIEVKLADEEPADLPMAMAIDIDDEEEDDDDFVAAQGEPMTVPCPNCEARLSLPGAGMFRCPRCRAPMEVDAEGMAQAYPEPAGHVAELTLPANEGYFTGAAWMITMAGLTAGLTEEQSQAAASSAQGCLTLLAHQVLTGNEEADERMHLFIRAEQERLSVRIYCGGGAIGSHEIFDPYRDGVDRLDYMASPEGNLIIMEKNNS